MVKQLIASGRAAQRFLDSYQLGLANGLGLLHCIAQYAGVTVAYTVIAVIVTA